VPFVIADKYAFVVATDGNLYAVSLSDGAVLWRSATMHQVAPTYDAGRIIVGRETFNVADGKKILDK
jgi:outer membrane protein assembly factor BamB